jgi:8-oxo-dGTP diphosphatase
MALAVIHRPKYDDWTLPKGKPDDGEALGETARREIHEELGCEIRFLEFAGVVHYPIGYDRTKVVLFWNMTPSVPFEFRPNQEVDQMLWLEKKDALRKLTHDVERELLAKCEPPPDV